MWEMRSPHGGGNMDYGQIFFAYNDGLTIVMDSIKGVASVSRISRKVLSRRLFAVSTVLLRPKDVMHYFRELIVRYGDVVYAVAAENRIKPIRLDWVV